MLIVPVKDGEPIERALKKFKKKFERTGVMKEMRARKTYIKPTVKRREDKLRAIFREQYLNNQD